MNKVSRYRRVLYGMNINRFFGISLACDIIPIPYPLYVVGGWRIEGECKCVRFA